MADPKADEVASSDRSAGGNQDQAEAALGDGTPDLSLQRRFWDGWNTENRTDGLDLDEYRRLQLDAAQRVARRLADELGRPLDICDFGCGTGWLAGSLRSFGAVTGIDLSPAACDWGRAHYPGVDFVVGDLLATELREPFDLVVSADVISHVADQDAFVDRVFKILRPNGTFLLMTQNGRVWSRTSYLAPQQPGQIRNWPSPLRLRTMFAGHFDIKHIGTIHPIGDQGVLRVVNSRWLSGPLRRVGLREPWRRARELAGLGSEYVIEARSLARRS